MCSVAREETTMVERAGSGKKKTNCCCRVCLLYMPHIAPAAVATCSLCRREARGLCTQAVVCSTLADMHHTTPRKSRGGQNSDWFLCFCQHIPGRCPAAWCVHIVDCVVEVVRACRWSILTMYLARSVSYVCVVRSMRDP